MSTAVTEFFKILVNKLPVRFLIVVLSVVLAWFLVMTAVALFTHRAIEFFPPHIGTDKAILVKLDLVSSELTSLEQNEQKQREKLINLLANARKRSIDIQQSGNAFGSTDAAIVVSNYETALKAEEEKYLKALERIEGEIRNLSNAL